MQENNKHWGCKNDSTSSRHPVVDYCMKHETFVPLCSSFTFKPLGNTALSTEMPELTDLHFIKYIKNKNIHSFEK